MLLSWYFSRFQLLLHVLRRGFGVQVGVGQEFPHDEGVVYFARLFPPVVAVVQLFVATNVFVKLELRHLLLH